MSWIWSKTREVKCKDGSVRTVYKDPNDAFPLYTKELSMQIQAQINLLTQLQVGVNANIQNLIAGLFVQIDNINRSIQLHFRAIYVAYMNNPCELDKWFADEVVNIIDDEYNLRNTITKLNAQAAKGQDIEEAISNAISDLITMKVRNIFEEIDKSRENVQKWRERSS